MKNKDQEAAAIIQKRLTDIVGTDGLNNLNALGDSSREVGKAWAELNLKLQAALSGVKRNFRPTYRVHKSESDAVGKLGNRRRLLDRLTPEQRDELESEEKEIVRGVLRENLKVLLATMSQDWLKISLSVFLQLWRQQHQN